jgi:hypothetical protein
MFGYKDFPKFKQHLRDFLVQTKAFASQDNAALFADEQAQLKEVTRHTPFVDLNDSWNVALWQH